MNVRNVDGADGRTARLIITDQGKENVVIVRLQEFFEHLPLLVGETVLICHPHGVLDLCVDVQRCDPLTIHGSGRQFVFQLVGIEKNFPQKLEFFLIHRHNVQPMFFVGRDLDRVHSQYVSPILKHGRFHALLHIQLIVWMFLHDTVDLIGKLAVQRRNRVRDFNFRAGVLPGEQDTERRSKQHPYKQDHHDNGNCRRAACANGRSQLFCRCRDCPQNLLSGFLCSFCRFDCRIPKQLPFADDSCSPFGSSCRRFAWQGFSRRCGGLDFRFRGCFDLLLSHNSRTHLLLNTHRFCRSGIFARWQRGSFICKQRFT